LWWANEERTEELVRTPLVGSGVNDSSCIELEEAEALLVSRGAVSLTLGEVVEDWAVV
jgi:hypothetical protein